MNQGKRTEIKQNFNRLTTMLFLNIKKEGGFKLDVLSECCFFSFLEKVALFVIVHNLAHYLEKKIKYFSNEI